MPAAQGDQCPDRRGESVGFAEGAQRVAGQFGPGGAGQQQGIDPRPETVAGEGAQEALFGALATKRDKGNEKGRKSAIEGEEARKQGGVEDLGPWG